jgi:circadian clock protein KaiC
VVDGLAGFADTVAFPERGYRFIGRLLRELKHRGITSIFTVDPDALTAAAGSCLTDGLLSWFDNVLDLRIQSDGVARSLEIRKLRGTRAVTARVDVTLRSSGPAAPGTN